MNKLIEWMTQVVAPKMNKIARNPWVAAVQEGILTCMPIIFIGSFVTMIGILAEFIEGFPDVNPLIDFSMGLLSVFLAYLIPYNILEKKKHRKCKKEAGIAGLSLFLMLCGPVFADGNVTFTFWNLGSGGMIASLVAGLFAGFVMNAFAGFTFFKEDSQIPDFITIWFDTLIPMLIVMVTGWLLVFVMNINMFDVISNAFAPVASIGDSLIGFLVIYFIGYVFLYTFGISTWVIWPLESAIVYAALAENQAAVAAGEMAAKLNVYGVTNYITIGGGGCTLALALMFCFMAKSKKNKLIGKATIIPSIFNINEPLIFGAPVAFNPILMVPMWIIGFIAPVVTWFALNFNLVPRISILWSFWYLPKPIGAFVVGGMQGLILLAIIFAISWIIYYPFFKIYDKQCLEEEQKAIQKG
ncbi:PTS sugar transporter subunit IIC [Dielma fastidiosa]|uniref:PTS sugar transporter subunit IIC n=1 Tax=Dielma fastidiosa TaxID=1034346 RepID=UPI000EC2349F|nr:PTS transporter subunit EIIC [Dielma fastidiosa]HAH93031.1 PTS cellobiose transporter subunit IIC [Dielma fastidiosa]